MEQSDPIALQKMWHQFAWISEMFEMSRYQKAPQPGQRLKVQRADSLPRRDTEGTRRERTSSPITWLADLPRYRFSQAGQRHCLGGCRVGRASPEGTSLA